MKICTHCGAGILEPNKPWICRGRIVCRRCFESLSPRSANADRSLPLEPHSPNVHPGSVGQAPADVEGGVVLDAATGTSDGARPLNGYGMAGLIIAVMGIFCLGLVSPIGLVMSVVGLKTRPRGMAIIATIIAALGTAYLVFWVSLTLLSGRHLHPGR